jgi:NADPH-dependent 2,4-dienoyl-CoA reductase/sulfur reductase-like enzyme
MRTVTLYHPNQEFAGVAEDFKRDFELRHPDKPVELISLETVEGAELAKLYDVVRYPAILVIAEDGHLQKVWQDQPFPMMDEVAAYLLNSL